MSITKDGSVLRLEGVCRVEEAETLAALLQAGDVTQVDLSACEGLHGAVAQALMAFGAAVRGEAADPFVRAWVAPALAAQTAASQHDIEHTTNSPEESN